MGKRRLDGEAGSAAATSRRVWIFDLEGRAAEIIDKIHDAAAHEIEAHFINHEPNSVGLDDSVIGFRRVCQTEAILETGASAAFNRETQDGRLALTLGDPGDASSSRGGKRDGHAQLDRDAE